RAADGGEWYRQRAGRARPAHGELTCVAALPSFELRCRSRQSARERALWAHRRRLHRRQGDAQGAVRTGRRWHRVARRNRRDAARYAAEVATCASREEGETVGRPRSEEHTSELQSRENLVCRLLLEKKKKKQFVLVMSNIIR